MTSPKCNLPDITKVLQLYLNSDVIKAVTNLLEHRIDVVRCKNDTAPIDEVVQNQGAIRELRWLWSYLNPKTR